MIIDDGCDHASINTGILSKYSKEQLREMLEERGINYPRNWTKQDMVDRLIQFEKDSPSDDDEVPNEDSSETNKLIRRLLLFHRYSVFFHYRSPLLSRAICYPHEVGKGQ